MGKMIEFACPDGSRCPGYLAEPAGKSAPGVVLIQEWWGLNDQMKETADRMASAGFRTLVPDLYRGELTTDADEANHKMNHLDWGRAAGQDIRGAIQHMKAEGATAAVMGFCMGGAMTIIAAANISETDAAVCFYGIPPAEAADPAKIRVPFQAHFATEDDWCTPAAVDALEQKLESGDVAYELHRYQGCHHAFFNAARPEVYDAEAAEQAWSRSIDFLKRNL